MHWWCTLYTVLREGVKKNYFFSSLLLLGGRGVCGDVKKLLGFFINYVFVGEFQYDSGNPKHALELKKSLNFFGFSRTQGPRG